MCNVLFTAAAVEWKTAVIILLEFGGTETEKLIIERSTRSFSEKSLSIDVSSPRQVPKLEQLNSSSFLTMYPSY